MIYVIDLKAQTNVMCSNRIIEFEEYQPIHYPGLARRAGLFDSFTYEFTILPDGKFDYKQVMPLPKNNRSAELFQNAIRDSILGWRFANNTGERIVFRLIVNFELLGEVQAHDYIDKNRVIFDQNVLTIKVIATKIIPRI